jgi:predicted NACHT family NTPase
MIGELGVRIVIFPLNNISLAKIVCDAFSPTNPCYDYSLKEIMNVLKAEQEMQESEISASKKQSRRILRGLTRFIRWGVWSLPSLTLATTVYFAKTGQLKEAAIGVALTFVLLVFAIFIQFFIDVIAGILEWIITRLNELEKPFINWITSRIETFLVGAWYDSHFWFQASYFKRLEYICRDFQVQGLEKNRVLRLQKVFVSLKISSKDIVQISSQIIQPITNGENNHKQKGIGDILAAMGHDPAFRRLAILGSPGSGKTTLLRYLTLMYAVGEHKKLHLKTPKLIPILLFLKDIRQDIVEESSLELADLITKQVKNLQTIKPLNVPSGWFKNRLARNQCLVMLDGLDEVADESERQKISQWIDSQIQKYPDLPFILTSRPFGYKNAQLEHEIFTLEVQPFSLIQMEQFIQSWYLQTEIMSRAGEYDLGVEEEAKRQADDLIERIKNDLSLVVMAVNPLLLTMIATVHYRGSALPGKRVELYKEICQVLLGKRQLAKKIPDSLLSTQKQLVLQTIALWLMNNNTRKFTVTEVDSLVQENLVRMVEIRDSSEDFLHQISNVSGLLIAKDQEGVYEFCHLSFQEYLASVEIMRSQQKNLLTNKFQNQKELSWWAETIRLYAAQNDTTDIIKSALQNPTVESLALAYDCLEEGLSIDPSAQIELMEKLSKDLESTDSEVAKLAAKVQLYRRLKYV